MCHKHAQPVSIFPLVLVLFILLVIIGCFCDF
ncbi:sporulation protein YjcZ [Bacillus shivajii]|nr:sporulation protein YjcZ [Bacillus shivajii]UCZ54119.1 sporulation protein YjcZ [Bacillus shivajii]